MCAFQLPAAPPPLTTSVTPGAPAANAAFPRNVRHRQTFHGKTEHNRGAVGEDDDAEIEPGQGGVAPSGNAGGRGFLSKLTKLTRR